MAAGPQNPNEAVDMMVPITITHVVLMVALAALVIVGIIWGTVLKRRRKAAREQVEANFAIAEEHGATTEPSATSEGAPAVPNETPAPEVPPMATKAAPIASDLTQIKGLGPKLAATLAEQGITRVEQIAALTPQAAAELDAKLGAFQGRMARDRWIEQAKLLAAGDRAGYEAAFGKLGG